MTKILDVGSLASLRAVEALVKIAYAVGSTLGPAGRPAIIERQDPLGDFKATYTKDGVTVLKSLEFNDPVENAIHYFCNQSASATVIEAGDGTTSLLVLAAAVAQAIVSSEAKTPQALARQFKAEAARACAAVDGFLVKDPSLLRFVALTSSNGDHEITDLVLDALAQVSAYGTIVVGKHPLQTEPYKIIFQDGYCAGRGYEYSKSLGVSCSDKAAENEPIFIERPYVFLYNGELNDVEQISQAINVIAQAGAGVFKDNLVCFAKDISEDLANKIVVQNRKLAGSGHPGRIFLSKYRINQEPNCEFHVMKDIEAVVGVPAFDGGNYRNATLADLGRCDRIEVQPFKTLLLGRSSNHKIPARAEQNARAAKFTSTPQAADAIASRNAELTEGLVTVLVGGGHSASIQERADRVDDAIRAVQAATREGVVPGAGVSYIRAANDAGLSRALAYAFGAVLRQLCDNYGTDFPDVPADGETIRFEEDGVIVGRFDELGVVDSAATVKSVIRNGVELGILCATTGCIAVTADLQKINDARTIFQAASRGGM